MDSKICESPTGRHFPQDHIYYYAQDLYLYFLIKTSLRNTPEGYIYQIYFTALFFFWLNQKIAMPIALHSSHDQVLRSQPSESPRPRSVVVAAQVICALPCKIAQQILADLPLYRLFQMSASLDDATYFNQCIMDHPKGAAVFGALDHFHHLRNLYCLFYEMHKAFKSLSIQFGNTSALAKSLNTFIIHGNVQVDLPERDCLMTMFKLATGVALPIVQEFQRKRIVSYKATGTAKFLLMSVGR